MLHFYFEDLEDTELNINVQTIRKQVYKKGSIHFGIDDNNARVMERSIKVFQFIFSQLCWNDNGPHRDIKGHACHILGGIYFGSTQQDVAPCNC